MGNIGFFPSSGVPSGCIVTWSGAVGDIPEDYALCDGSNGTPDLRDRFIVGAGSGYGVGDTGGEAAHVLIGAEMPSHHHTYETLVSASSTGYKNQRVALVWKYCAELKQSRNTGSKGGGGAHENRPPYYSLAYIMKL